MHKYKIYFSLFFILALLFILNIGLVSTPGNLQAQASGQHIDKYDVNSGSNADITEMFGDGHDGDLIVNAGETKVVSTVRFNVITASGMSVIPTASNGFQVGDTVFFHQTQGTHEVGRWEFNVIESINSNTNWTLETPLSYTYNSSDGKAQVIKVPQYRNLTVRSGGTLTGPSWDGNTGGLIVLQVQNKAQVSGSIQINGRNGTVGTQGNMPETVGGGFRGSYADHVNSDCQGGTPTGEGDVGPPKRSSDIPNGSGGGRANFKDGGCPGSSGGGGGNGTRGGSRSVGNLPGGEGGFTSGNAQLTLMNLGGGGSGSAHEKGRSGSSGASGGGIVTLYSRELSVNGRITANGGSGGGTDVGGGGGAGGSILLKSDTMSIGSNRIIATGGSGGARAGSGGLGRIRIEYCESTTGSTSPTASQQKLNCVAPTPTFTSTFTPTSIPTTPPPTDTPKVPDIRVTPNALSMILPEGQTTTMPLTIHNLGDADLTWSTSKQNTNLVRAANTTNQNGTPSWPNIVSDTINDAFDQLQSTSASWWNNAYGCRQRLNFTGGLNKDAIIKIDSIDFNALQTQGKLRADRKDLRVVRWVNQSRWTEIPRVHYLDTDVEFHLPSDLSNGANTEYYIYYCNPNAGNPPTFTKPAQGYWVDMYTTKHYDENSLRATRTYNVAMNFDNVCDSPINHRTHTGGSDFDDSDRFRGRIYIPHSGIWTFKIFTNDGYYLNISGNSVGRFDEYRIGQWATVGSKNLKAGWHLFEGGNMWVGCGSWKVKMSGPNYSEKIIPANYFQQEWGSTRQGVGGLAEEPYEQPTSTPTKTPTPTHTPTPTRTPTPTFTPQSPDIRITPSSFSKTLHEGQATTVPLTIHNLGNAGLVVSGIAKQMGNQVQAADSTHQNRPPEKVDAALLNVLSENERADFIIYLTEQANLDHASQASDRETQGRRVYDTLVETARRSQAELLTWLDEQQQSGHVERYQSFFIINAIAVTGNRATVEALAQREDVAYIGLELIYSIPEPEESQSISAAATNDVAWGISKIRADKVWEDFNIDGTGIVVVNIDTGVDHTHPALARQYLCDTNGTHDYCWYDPTGLYAEAPGDNNGHGTHTMGTILGSDGGSNKIGVAPGARWIAVKGCGSSECRESHLMSVAQWILAPCPIGVEPGSPECDPTKRPHIVNNSWGGNGGRTYYQNYVDQWRAAGIFPVFSAGNSGRHGEGTVGSPGDYANTCAVGATDSQDRIAPFSSRGPSRMTREIKPDVSAPGAAIRSAVPNGRYKFLDGTSMAAPHVAGTVALLLQANPQLSSDFEQIETIIANTAVDLGQSGPDYLYGYGRIDAYAAVEAAQTILPWLTYTPKSGTVAPGEKTTVEVTFSAAGLEPGTYTAQFVITSNDPDTPSITVPVTLVVGASLPQISDIRVANLSDKGAAIGWITDLSASGKIRYGTDPFSLSNIAEDVRGGSQRDDVHLVALNNLAPNTLYYYSVISGEREDDNGGEFYTFTTGAALSIPGTDAVYGMVLKNNGEPAANVLLYLQLLDDDGNGTTGKSAWLAGMTDNTGYWYDLNNNGPINLGAARSYNHSDYFVYGNGDLVGVEVQGSADCGAKEQFALAEFETNQTDSGEFGYINGRQAPEIRLSCLQMTTIELPAGWNAIPFSFIASDYSADSLMADVLGIDEVNVWNPDTGNWVSKPRGIPIGNFSIKANEPYFIRTEQRILLRLEGGTGLHTSDEVALTTGWNFISLLPTAPILNAADACTQVADQGGQISELARWSGNNWVSYPCGLPFGNFELVPETAYFIKSHEVSTWIPQTGSVNAAQESMVSPSYPQADRTPVISDIRLTNVNDGSITVIWQTDKPAIGQIHFGNQAGERVNTAHDDRGEMYVGIVHQVTLTSLRAETAYQLEIHSGETIHDNGGLFHQVETRPALSIPSVETAYGQVQDSAGNPIVGAQVYATVSGSAPLSAITNLQGYWSLNLGALRTADGTQYLNVMDGTLDIEVITSVGITGSQSLAIESLTPAPTLVLDEGYSIYLPLITR